MSLIDWVIVGIFVLFLVGITLASRQHMKSVADFLAASRCAGRYLISVSEGAAGLGAITLIAFWEMYHERGFTAVWWNLPNWPIIFIVALTGWVSYRFRQTRALTLAQFFEMRYSRKFRIFAGMIMFTCGVVNFGIFPAVGTRFFIYFCGLPAYFDVAGVHLNTYSTLMASLLAMSLFFTFTGGQIAIILTDFLQGILTLSILVITVIILLFKVQWHNVTSALLQQPPGDSFVNPFEMQQATGFNVRYFMILYVMWFYRWMAWQGTQGFNASAKSPHEQKMAKVLGTWRYFGQEMLIPVIAICALAFLRHPELFPAVSGVQNALEGIANEKVRTQMTVPMALSHLLPVGLMGGLCAMMFAAFISNHNSYLHSWGSILVQDVIMPIRGRSFEPRTHLLLLRLAILSVALFIYMFSLLFEQSQYILMFFQATGGIYLGGAGAVIIGGLYWKRGTTHGAYTALIVGAVASLIGLALLEFKPQTFGNWPQLAALLTWSQKHITGQDMCGIASGLAVIAYVVVSLAQSYLPFNLDRMLHRGEYADANAPAEAAATGLGIFKMGPEYSRSDKILYLASYGWMTMCGAVFLFGLAYHRMFGTTAEGWTHFWYYLVWLAVGMGSVMIVWFTVGGLRDMFDMLRLLRTAVRDHSDDGMVREQVSKPAQVEEQEGAQV